MAHEDTGAQAVKERGRTGGRGDAKAINCSEWDVDVEGPRFKCYRLIRRASRDKPAVRPAVASDRAL